MTLLAQNALRMELNSLYIQLLMAQTHDLVKRAIGVFTPGGNLEAVGQSFPFHDERMVAGDPQRIVERLEYAPCPDGE